MRTFSVPDSRLEGRQAIERWMRKRLGLEWPVARDDGANAVVGEARQQRIPFEVLVSERKFLEFLEECFSPHVLPLCVRQEYDFQIHAAGVHLAYLHRVAGVPLERLCEVMEMWGLCPSPVVDSPRARRVQACRRWMVIGVSEPAGPPGDPRAYGYAALREITDDFRDVVSTFTVGDVAGLLCLPMETDPALMQRVATWLSGAPRAVSPREQHLWIVGQLAAGWTGLDGLLPLAPADEMLRAEAAWAARDDPDGYRPLSEVLREAVEGAADGDGELSGGAGYDDEGSAESDGVSDG